MSKARIMSAGTVGTSKRVRVNGPEGGGNALQGLPPICNMRSALVPYVRTRSDGSDRNLIFCVNQLGGVGAKRGQFGPGNRAGVGKTGGCSDEGQYGGRYFGTALHGMLGGAPSDIMSKLATYPLDTVPPQTPELFTPDDEIPEVILEFYMKAEGASIEIPQYDASPPTTAEVVGWMAPSTRSSPPAEPSSFQYLVGEVSEGCLPWSPNTSFRPTAAWPPCCVKVCGDCCGGTLGHEETRSVIGVVTTNTGLTLYFDHPYPGYSDTEFFHEVVITEVTDGCNLSEQPRITARGWDQPHPINLWVTENNLVLPFYYKWSTNNETKPRQGAGATGQAYPEPWDSPPFQPLEVGKKYKVTFNKYSRLVDENGDTYTWPEHNPV